jgi:hypothetical protein
MHSGGRHVGPGKPHLKPMKSVYIMQALVTLGFLVLQVPLFFYTS